ncbi:VanZ family protein [Candidatus Venteria ishoeyi]|uniref:VanZ like family protein n=1 Tax=Candidatus Venteria ishoeyi TaxID=1899563 RepID=A0A1H6FE79_9GAMM|nr:VanZ family protein [Candidatus Venteria ishoeyi]MDM8546977.1 VanZ family protein [Candidatus Venteria ishoeyi]SEH07324.1 VanZ like family protein [Candidatus Venteria ishoeyi]
MGKELRSWVYVTLWSVFIFIAIPFARTIEALVDKYFGSSFFLYVVLIFIIIASVVLLLELSKRKLQTGKNKVWLLTVTVAFIAYTIHLREMPEEAVHFVLYSVLGVFLFRALAHRNKDYSIYFSAAALGAIIGTLDETIQWIVPGRYWELADIWINFFAVVLVQIGIAKGFNPSFISAPVRASSLLFLSRVLIVFVVLMQLTFLNTTPRIAWYAEKIPLLDFLRSNESVMVEYGYLYKDPDTGIFRSRLNHDELKQTDAARAKEAVAIINQYTKEKYSEFLQKYTPISDPFLHECLVHLFSRNVNAKRADKYKDNPEKYSQYITRAYYENNILEKYFSETFKPSKFFWDRQYLADMKQAIDRQMKYESATSRNLITKISALWIQLIFIAILAGLLYLSFQLSRHGEKS